MVCNLSPCISKTVFSTSAVRGACPTSPQACCSNLEISAVFKFSFPLSTSVVNMLMLEKIPGDWDNVVESFKIGAAPECSIQRCFASYRPHSLASS